MSDPPDFDETIRQMEARYWHPAVQRCLDAVRAVAGYDLQPTQHAPFLRFHAFLTTEPRPQYIVRWRSSQERIRWYHRHVDGILGQVQNAVACVWYHRDNLCAIEDAVRKIVISSGALEVLENMTTGVPNAIRWDAEYQAFLLAVRRCLDYLTRALAAYFETEFHSFRKLPDFLGRAAPRAVADALLMVHHRHKDQFDYVLSTGERKSTRDILSHYRYIGAGTFNLSGRGFTLAGGGERLPVADAPDWDGGLDTIIVKRANHLLDCISDLLSTFAASVAEHERAGA